LIEILITIGLLSFIILGLMLMFQQVQKAFRSSMTQTDVMESGRSITDMIIRDLEEMAPLQLPYDATNYPFTSLNFLTGISAYSPIAANQDLPGTTVNSGSGIWRTNTLQNFFFTSKSNQTFIGTGYCVLTNYQDGTGVDAVGTLYRYTTNCNRYSATNLVTMYLAMSANATNLNMHRIADGVVHFKIQAYDTNGTPLILSNAIAAPPLPQQLYFSSFTNLANGQPSYTPVLIKNTRWVFDGLSEYYYYSNAVPAYVELEIGFLEQRTLDRYRALAEGSISAARSYLTNHAAQVQIFRQRIPIRAVDYAAYQ
jgi:hypothetical protein